MHTADSLRDKGEKVPETPDFKKWTQANYKGKPDPNVGDYKIDWQHLVDLFVEENAQRVHIMGKEAAARSWERQH